MDVYLTSTKKLNEWFACHCSISSFMWYVRYLMVTNLSHIKSKKTCLHCINPDVFFSGYQTLKRTSHMKGRVRLFSCVGSNMFPQILRCNASIVTMEAGILFVSYVGFYMTRLDLEKKLPQTKQLKGVSPKWLWR